MQFLYVLFALMAGIGSTLQSGANMTLAKDLGLSCWAIVFVSLVVLIVSLTIATVGPERFPNMAALSQPPWWAWTGGLCGCLFIFVTVFVSSKLGAGMFIALTVTASTVLSLMLDNYGWMGFAVHPARIGRIIGGLLMIAGVALISLF